MKTFIWSLFLIVTPILAENVEQSVISANNRFAADLYKEVLRNEELNFLVSPFSAESVFALAQSGARGQTAEELRTGFRLPHNQTQIEEEFKNIFPKLRSESDLYSFHLANKLYLDKKFAVKEDFKKTAVEAFGADLENVEFVKTVEAAKTINQWVEEKTEKKIRDLVDSKDLDPNTVAVIVNALFFKGNWSISFSKRSTGKRTFYHVNTKVSPVDTMYQYNDQKRFVYAENQELDAKFLEMGFQGGDASMVIVLPNEKYGITNLEKQIEKVFAFNAFGWENVNISLPKFKTETKIDLKKILQNLGVKKPFTNGQADFRGISDKNLYIDQAIQKTFINVYENGVEAAAATSASYSEASYTEPTEPKQFHADHPFIYFIKVKDLIVFAGRVGSPNF